jgi:hypothetical protein
VRRIGTIASSDISICLKAPGFVEVEAKVGEAIYIKQITRSGHDFIDSVRDPKIWSDTKHAAEKVGGWTADMLAGIAKAYLKGKAAELGFSM